MAAELAKTASADQMLRNLTLTGPSTLQSGLQDIFSLRKRMGRTLVRQCLFFTHVVAKVSAALNDDKSQRPKFNIGLIGCGLVGRSIVDALLDRGYPPEDILISTRSPHTLTRYKSMGIKCTHNTPKVARQCRLLFVVCLPAQAQTVAADLRGNLRRKCLVVSTILGLEEKKLMQLFNTPVVLCARTASEFGRASNDELIEQMDQYHTKLLEEASAGDAKWDTHRHRHSSSDSEEFPDAYAEFYDEADEDAAVEVKDVSGEAKGADETGEGGGEGEAKGAEEDDPETAAVIAEAVEDETRSARLVRLSSAHGEAKERLTEAWKSHQHMVARDHHLAMLRERYTKPKVDAEALRSVANRVAALHLCRHEEQLRRVFVAVAFFAMKCGIPRDFAQLLACQETLGVDVGDMGFLTERAREKVARRHRRSSGLGPVIHTPVSDDQPTLEFPLAGFIVERKLPVFWKQFEASVDACAALPALEPEVDEFYDAIAMGLADDGGPPTNFVGATDEVAASAKAAVTASSAARGPVSPGHAGLNASRAR